MTQPPTRSRLSTAQKLPPYPTHSPAPPLTRNPFAHNKNSKPDQATHNIGDIIGKLPSPREHTRVRFSNPITIGPHQSLRTSPPTDPSKCTSQLDPQSTPQEGPLLPGAPEPIAQIDQLTVIRRATESTSYAHSQASASRHAQAPIEAAPHSGHLGPIQAYETCNPEQTNSTARGTTQRPISADTQFLASIRRAVAQPSPKMSSPEFCFEWTQEAANHNWKILEKYDLDVGIALQHQAGTPLAFGSEFRTCELLEPVTSHHPLWPKLRQWLTDGVTFPLKTLNETERMSDLNLAILRGNHKSAKIAITSVKKLLHKEVERGWQLPLPPEKLAKLPGAIVAPLGLVSQNTINDRGEIIPKDRITHDQSFDFSPSNSVNHRVIPDSLTPCRYGTAMKRLVHYTVDTRRRHPRIRILVTKLDVKAAYRRLHCAASTALSACVIVGFLALMGLRLMFGASPNPSIWSDLSELMCDLGNQLARCIEWNEHDSPDLELPHQQQYVNPPRYLVDDVPLAMAQPTTVTIDSDDYPYTEVYLDDFITVFLDLKPMIWKGSRVSLLLLHVLGRPIHKEEPITREDLLAFDKTVAEGTPEEIKLVLGWVINTRTLTLALPEDKRASWTKAIHQLLEAETVSHDDIMTTIGRLNHAAYVIPTARAFFCHLRRLELHLKHQKSHTKLDTEQVDELSHWTYFLQKASEGLSLNLLNFRAPTILLQADACEHGVGGYSLHSGQAWPFDQYHHTSGGTSA